MIKNIILKHLPEKKEIYEATSYEEAEIEANKIGYNQALDDLIAKLPEIEREIVETVKSKIMEAHGDETDLQDVINYNAGIEDACTMVDRLAHLTNKDN